MGTMLEHQCNIRGIGNGYEGGLYRKNSIQPLWIPLTPIREVRDPTTVAMGEDWSGTAR